MCRNKYKLTYDMLGIYSWEHFLPIYFYLFKLFKIKIMQTDRCNLSDVNNGERVKLHLKVKTTNFQMKCISGWLPNHISAMERGRSS